MHLRYVSVRAYVVFGTLRGTPLMIIPDVLVWL